MGNDRVIMNGEPERLREAAVVTYLNLLYRPETECAAPLECRQHCWQFISPT